MKFWVQLLLLTIVDFLVIWLWVRQADPSPDISIAILLLVAYAIGFNIIIAVLLYFVKRKYATLLVVNSLIAGALMFFLFHEGIVRHQNKRVEGWRFNIKDSTFEIQHWKMENTFSISESTTPWSSTSFLEGKFISNGNEYLLATDSTSYQIRGEYLFGFRKSIDSIKLIKVHQ
ncbi:hypothetical protein BH09BAC3_BH09BAC3_32610 [soil metagenome]